MSLYSSQRCAIKWNESRRRTKRKKSSSSKRPNIWQKCRVKKTMAIGHFLGNFVSPMFWMKVLDVWCQCEIILWNCRKAALSTVFPADPLLPAVVHQAKAKGRVITCHFKCVMSSRCHWSLVPGLLVLETGKRKKVSLLRKRQQPRCTNTRLMGNCIQSHSQSHGGFKTCFQFR